MIRSAYLLAILSFVFASCEEVPPFIDFSSPGKSKDTTYISATVPPAQHKAVLIEDVTGVRCNNCPRAAQKAKDIITQKTEDSVVVMAIYSVDFNTTLTSPYPGFPNMNNAFSTQIISALGNPNGLPSGYVDRAKFGAQTVRYNSDLIWQNLVAERLKLTTPVNISLQKSLSGRKLTIRVSLVYNSASSANHKYALYLTESGIVSRQLTTSGEVDNYVHNHVLRYAFGNALGTPMNQTLVAGRTFERELEFEIPSEYVIPNCHVVCVVSDADTEAVVNVRQIHLQ